MQNTLLLDIALFLVSQGIGTADGVDIFRDFSPEDPDNIIILNEYKGDPPSVADSVVNRSVQVLVRDLLADTARQKALEIYKKLNTENTMVSFSSSRVASVTLRQTPFKIDQDKNRRVIYGFNMGILTTIE